jgi:hypothetical protein
MKLKWIFIGFVLLILAISIGVFIAGFFITPVAAKNSSIIEEVEEEVLLEEESDLLDVETTYSIMTELLKPKLEALDVESVHNLILRDVEEESQKKEQWSKKELVFTLDPIVISGVDAWIEGTITSVASDNEYELNPIMIQTLRDRFDRPDWYAFMTLYEIAFLGSEGIIIINEN